jgi:hypothetical protein
MSVGTTQQAVHGVAGDSSDSRQSDRDPEQAIPLEGKDTETGISSELQEEETTDVVPNGGYGWVNVGCVVLQNSVTWGTSTYSCCSLTIRILLNDRCQYYIWRLLGVLPSKQSFRRRIHLWICLGRRAMRSCSTAHCAWGELPGQDVWV